MTSNKTKKCKCGTILGQKTKTCRMCGHKFEFIRIKNPKRCPQCTTELRPRAKSCDKCQYVYPVKNTKKFEEITNWKSLKKGQTVLIKSNGKGPIYINESNKKYLMGYRGKFTVMDVKENGIVAISAKEGGFCFIYMGKRQQSKKVENLLLRPHKLLKKL